MLAVLLLAACSRHTDTGSVMLLTSLDSLNYALGVYNGAHIRLMADSTDEGPDAFLRGIQDGLADTAVHKADDLTLRWMAWYVAREACRQAGSGLLGDSLLMLHEESFIRGVKEGLSQNEAQARAMMRDARTGVDSIMEQIRTGRRSRIYASNRIRGQHFMDSVGRADTAVVRLKSGLMYKVLHHGEQDGVHPADTSVVELRYEISGTDGIIVGTNRSDDAPLTVRVDELIGGCAEGLLLMTQGSRFRLYVPDTLAFGARQVGQIRPFSTLICELELIKIENSKHTQQ